MVLRLKPFVQPHWQKWPSYRMTWSIHKKPQRLRKAILTAISHRPFGDRLARIDPYDPQVYQKRRKIFKSFKEEGWLIQETAPIIV